MTTLTIAEFSAALAIGHLIDSFIEVKNVKSKVTRLSDIVHKRTVKPFPVNINTRLKAYTSLFGLYAVLSAVAYFLLRWMNLSLRTTIWIAIVAIVLSQVVYVVGLDRYHVSIAKVTRLLEKK